MTNHLWQLPIGVKQLYPSTDNSIESDWSVRSLFRNGTGILPIEQHPGAFGVMRKHHTHEGVDIYCPVGEDVYAVEDGVVTAVKQFTGSSVGSPWWRDTFAVWVEGNSGTVLYGEIYPGVFPGQIVKAGDFLGSVLQVIKNPKGKPTSMLHLELHVHGDISAPEWLVHEEKPECLLDPTPFLLPHAPTI